MYHYTDHLGNIRLSYGLDPETGLIKIMEENHYYPFGLKHDNYNTQHLGYSSYTDENEIEYIVLAEMPKFVGDGSYNYKYQGQERQDELGLNWDSFKWRNYDYALGRFMSIDPLAEKYAYNSTYAFQENKMGMGRELEGLELIPFDQIKTYFTAVKHTFIGKTEQARSNLKTSINNRVEVSITGKEKNNVQVGNYNVNKVSDYGTMSNSIKTISDEAKVATKQVVRDGADALETTGDAMVVAAPATGPAAPAVAAIGSTMSTVGTATNITLDVVEGDYKSASKRVVNEAITGGLSTLAKNAPGVDETTSQLIDAHIVVYDNVIIPIVQEKKEEKQN